MDFKCLPVVRTSDVLSTMLFFKRHDAKTYHCVAALLGVFFIGWIVAGRLLWRRPPEATRVEVKIFEKEELSSSIQGLDKKKIKQHVPKFMLELYESSRRNDGNDVPDVVRSLIPKSTGRVFAKNIIKNIMEFISGILCGSEKVEHLGDNHLLIFDLPETGEDETFLEAELRILTLIELNSEVLKGKIVFFSNFIIPNQLFLRC